MTTLQVRVAREEDLPRLVEIHACAYPDGGSYDHHERKFTHASFGGLSNFRVVEAPVGDVPGSSASRVVGHAALYPLELWVAGRKLMIGGIASLGVAPEARRQGAAHALLERMHHELETQNAALALLYPFRERFYQGLGYATTAPLVSLRVAAHAFASAWDAHRAELVNHSVASLDGAGFEQAKLLYDEVGRRGSGFVVRSEARWMRLFSRETRHWISIWCEGRLDGYASFSYDAPVSNGRQNLVVHELVARTEPARRAALAVLSRQGDQVEDIELVVPFGDPLPMALADACGSRRGDVRAAHPLGLLAAGPMVRIANLRAALAGRGYAADGEITLRATDASRPETVRLVVRAGSADVGPSTAVPDVEMPRAILGSILVSGMRPSEAADLGFLRGHHAAVRLADDLFSGPRFRCLDPF